MIRRFFNVIAICFVVCCFDAAFAAGDDVDVYFVTGQSNAGNFAKEAGTGSDMVNFTMHFARSADNFNDFPNHSGVAQSFSSNVINASLATSILATELQQGGRDVAIFSFARIGAGLHLNTSPDGNPWIWYAGRDPAGGVLYNDALYANNVTWFHARLAELTAQGHSPTIKGLFWFQGEKDGRLGDHNLYEQNFDNLVYRFRQDYGPNLPVVTTQIREVTDTAANRAVINAILAQAASEDPRTGYVLTEDLEFRSPTDVHLNSNGHASLAPRWSKAMLSLQNTPVTVTPDSYDFEHGIYSAGQLTDLSLSDNVDLSGFRNNSDIQSRVHLVCSATVSIANPQSLSVGVEAAVVARMPIVQSIELFDYQVSDWEKIDQRNASRFVDQLVETSANGALTRFVEQSTNTIKVRIRFDSASARQSFSANIDSVYWQIN